MAFIFKKKKQKRLTSGLVRIFNGKTFLASNMDLREIKRLKKNSGNSKERCGCKDFFSLSLWNWDEG
jgi:hypothetical protein